MSNLDWILRHKEKESSTEEAPPKTVEESFMRLVDARKASVRGLEQVGRDLIELDEDLKKKKVWTTAVSITGN